MAINPHLIEQCENLLESYLMQARFAHVLGWPPLSGTAPGIDAERCVSCAMLLVLS